MFHIYVSKTCRVSSVVVSLTAFVLSFTGLLESMRSVVSHSWSTPRGIKYICMWCSYHTVCLRNFFSFSNKLGIHELKNLGQSPFPLCVSCRCDFEGHFTQVGSSTVCPSMAGLFHSAQCLLRLCVWWHARTSFFFSAFRLPCSVCDGSSMPSVGWQTQR